MPRPSLTYLRVSITSRCNLRCVYCQPASESAGRDVLSKAELVRFVELAVACGIRKVRVTGGEPLVRADLVELVRELVRIPDLDDLGLTTNATRLSRLARPLREAGLRRINIGLPAIDPAVYRRVTRVGNVDDALAGLHAALEAGFEPVKVNVVVMRDVNDGQVAPLAELTRHAPVEVRFIEYMPFVEDAEERDRHLVPAQEVLARVRELGEVEPLDGERGPASAQRYRIRGFEGVVGIIAPHSAPFCAACNRVRLTADGHVRSCLIDGGESNILPLIRAGLDLSAMRRILAGAAARKPERHAGTFRGHMRRIGG